MDPEAIVTSVPKTNMASPSLPHYPVAPCPPLTSVFVTALSPKNATNGNRGPPVNSLTSRSASTGSGDGSCELAASPSDLDDKSAVILPLLQPHGKKSPSSPENPGEGGLPRSCAVFQRSVMPSASQKHTTLENRCLMPPLVDNCVAVKSHVGLVLTCRDRLQTALEPKTIIKYKSVDGFTSSGSESGGRDNESSSKRAPEPSLKNKLTTLDPRQKEVGDTEAALQNPEAFSVDRSPTGTGVTLSEETDKRVSMMSLSGEFPLFNQTNNPTSDSASPSSKGPSRTDVKVRSMDRKASESTLRPTRLDFAWTQDETTSKSSSKCPPGNGSRALSHNLTKSEPLRSKRSAVSPTKPRMIAKSPSCDKTDKKMHRSSISSLKELSKLKMEDGASATKTALPSKLKTVKSVTTEKTDKRYKNSTSVASWMSEKASSSKTNMASPTNQRTLSRAASVSDANIADPPDTPQAYDQIQDISCLSPRPNPSSPTKPKTPLKSPSVDKVAPKKICGPAEPPLCVRPPWRGGSWTPSRPHSASIRRSESSVSVNAGLRSRAGVMRPATSLPHIPKASSSRPCLLVALRPINLQQERELFFQSGFQYEPQFEYQEAELSAVLDKYREGCGLFLQQAVGIMECVLRKYGSYENFEDVTGGSVLPKSQVWSAVRKYLQKEGCVGEVVVRLSDELLSQAVMVVENCRPTLTINLSGARQHWLEGMLRHEIGTHYLRGVNNSLQPWASSERRKALGLKGANPTEEGLASLHSVLLRRQPHLWRAALLYYTVHHAAAMSFSQLFHHIQRFVDNPDVRWEYCLRAKRGQTDTSRPGCFSKDQVYLDGILRILRHRRSIDFQLLTALGKVSFEDVSRLRPLADLSRTRIPHFMLDSDKYQAQLDHILSTNNLSDTELQHLLP